MVGSPSISAVVTTYNCKHYLGQCLESLMDQTYLDFEIIVVDDGSTDGSFELAEEYASQNSFMTVYQQNHAFAGAARNLGLSKAVGDYIIFLDGDDFFDKHLLEKSLTRITETHADICVFAASSFNDITKATKPLPQTCREGLFGTAEVFNRNTNPQHILCFTNPAAWNKLFKKSFLEKQGLQFQNTRSANDIYFVLMALSLAERITLLNEPLLFYRQQNSSSLQSTQGKNPFAFYEALGALKAGLEEKGLMGELQQSFTNTALDSCIYNLHTLRNCPREQKRVYRLLKTKAFDEFNISNKKSSYFYVYPESRFTDYQKVRHLPYCLFRHQAKIRKVKTRIRKMFNKKTTRR